MGGSLPQIVGMRGCVSGYVGGYGSIAIAVVYTNISGCVPPHPPNAGNFGGGGRDIC